MDTSSIIQQMLIILILMIVGYFAMRIHILNDETNVSLSNILLKIGVPGMILGSVKEPTKYTGTQLFMILAFFFIFCIFLGVLSNLEVIKKKQDKALWQFMWMFNNAGFMGLPIVQALLGDEAMLIGALFLLPNNLLMFGYGESLFKKGQFSLKKVMNAPVIASIIALFICIFHIKEPYVIGQACTYLGNITTPISMMIVGAGLVKIDLKSILDKNLILFIIIKMIILPILYAYCFKLIGIDDLVCDVVIMIMAMPVASNSVLYANIYDQNAPLASKVTAFTSVLSVITIPIVFMCI